MSMLVYVDLEVTDRWSASSVSLDWKQSLWADLEWPPGQSPSFLKHLYRMFGFEGLWRQKIEEAPYLQTRTTLPQISLA